MAVVCGVRLIVSDNPFHEGLVKKAKESGEEVPVCKMGRQYSFTALIKNNEGYKDLCELMTLGNRREQFYFIPRISLRQLIETYAKGNILLLTSDRDSIFHRPDFVSILSALLSTGGRDNFYSVVYPISTPLYDQLNKKAMSVAQALKIAPVAFYPAYYEKEEDADLRDIAHMVINNIKTDQPYRFHIPHQRDNSIQDRKHLLVRLMEFAKRMNVEGVSSAMVNDTQDEIIAECSWRWHEMPVSLPVMAEDEGEKLTRMAAEGLKRRLTTLEFGWKPPAEQYPMYINRLRYELSVLKRTGFCGYFLMVENLLTWAREEDIPVGLVAVHLQAHWLHGLLGSPILTLYVMDCCLSVSSTRSVSTYQMLIWTSAGHSASVFLNILKSITVKTMSPAFQTSHTRAWLRHCVTLREFMACRLKIWPYQSS